MDIDQAKRLEYMHVSGPKKMVDKCLIKPLINVGLQLQFDLIMRNCGPGKLPDSTCFLIKEQVSSRGV